MVWSPLAGGFLSGKYTREKPKGESGDRLGGFDFLPYDRARGYDLVDVLREIGEKRGATPAQVSIAWLLTRPSVSSILIGASSAAQLADNVAAVDVKLAAEDLAALDAATKATAAVPELVHRSRRGRQGVRGARDQARGAADPLGRRRGPVRATKSSASRNMVAVAAAQDLDPLREFLERHPRLFVLTGAGVSTDSGIPDYRDADGDWKRASRPVMFRDFMNQPATRKRYWARGLVGWQHLHRAVPNDAHRALARLERAGRVELLVTQNVDRLHQAAGSEAVVDLHGRADVVRCMGCERRISRADFQAALVGMNSDWAELGARAAPDGDADLVGADYDRFRVPDCSACGGTLKPDVVFFGESVPRERVARAMQALAEADAVLVIGSSLMVFSGYRFARAAAGVGKPIAAVNLGRTRADSMLTLKISATCSSALPACVE